MPLIRQVTCISSDFLIYLPFCERQLRVKSSVTYCEDARGLRGRERSGVSARSFFSKLSLGDGTAEPVTVALIDVYLSVLPRRALITRFPSVHFTLASSPRMRTSAWLFVVFLYSGLCAIKKWPRDFTEAFYNASYFSYDWFHAAMKLRVSLKLQ